MLCAATLSLGGCGATPPSNDSGGNVGGSAQSPNIEAPVEAPGEAPAEAPPAVPDEADVRASQEPTATEQSLEEPSPAPDEENLPIETPTPEPSGVPATDDYIGQTTEVVPEVAVEECVTGTEDVCLDVSMEQAPLGATPPQTGVTADPQPYTVEEYVTYVIEDLNTKWSAWFTSSGFNVPQVYYVLVGPEDTAHVMLCKPRVVVAHDHPNAYYCSTDPYPSPQVSDNGSIILPLTTMQRMWTGEVLMGRSATVGDFAAAVITAHEFGHHVQDELRLQWEASYPNQVPAFTGSNKELIADCFAGNWMATTYYDGFLEPGDYEEAVAALEAVGAPQPGGSHGTPPQRKEALLIGYHGDGTTEPGHPQACINQYWR